MIFVIAVNLIQASVHQHFGYLIKNALKIYVLVIFWECKGRKIIIIYLIF